MHSNIKVLAIIPARGGSKGIPRKNIRLLNGKPLIAYTIDTALSSKYITKVVVSTDDLEISSVAKKYGAQVVIRPDHLATDEVPLDPVINNAVEIVENGEMNFDIVLTIQPTSPLLTVDTLDSVIEKVLHEDYETVLTAVDDRHLSWTKDDDKYIPKYHKRENRQYLPSEYRETGAVLASKRSVVTSSSRIGERVSLHEVDKYESIDIDSPMDWWVAEKILNRKKVVIRVDGYKEIGLGHIYRTLTLANEIMDHELLFLMNEEHELGISMIKSNNYNVETFKGDALEKLIEINPDIVINDILDTSKNYVLSLRELGFKVFNFEDLGSGAEFADGVFNALYPGNVPTGNFYTGEKYYCCRNEFLDITPNEISEKVNSILITFGGTDPNNLTLKVLRAIASLESEVSINIVLGPGYSNKDELYNEISEYDKNIEVFHQVSNMAEFMHKADIVFSSAGRTMYEIAMTGTPGVIIAQNSREMTHLFGHNYNGFINLGLHQEVDQEDIQSIFNRLLDDSELRKLMNKRMLSHDLKNGIRRVLDIIFTK